MIDTPGLYFCQTLHMFVSSFGFSFRKDTTNREQLNYANFARLMEYSKSREPDLRHSRPRLTKSVWRPNIEAPSLAGSSPETPSVKFAKFHLFLSAILFSFHEDKANNEHVESLRLCLAMLMKHCKFREKRARDRDWNPPYTHKSRY